MLVLRGCTASPGRNTSPGCSGWSRLCDHAAAVPAVRRVLRAFGSVPRQNGGHSSCMQIMVRIVHPMQQTMEISQVQFWGWLSTRLLLCNDRCPGWVAQKTVEFPQLQCLRASSSSWTKLLCPLVQRLWVAQCLVRLWIPVIVQGGFWKNFTIFYVKGLNRLPSSIHVLPAHRRQRQWLVPYWFCWY